MSQSSSTTQRANYGLDAPEVVRRFAFLGMAGVLLGSLLLLTNRFPAALGLGNAFLWMGASFLYR